MFSPSQSRAAGLAATQEAKPRRSRVRVVVETAKTIEELLKEVEPEIEGRAESAAV